MKVLNLQCGHQHSFEGWFGSEEDFQAQRARGLIECPMCADKDIQKMPSAPRLNLGGHPAQEVPEKSSDKLRPALPAADRPDDAGAGGTPPGANSVAQGAFLKALRHAVANTEDVGDRFTHEVRRMHYGDAESRSIRGKASLKETVELLEEGIDIMPLPPSIKETLQ
ncbi:MAG: DUF1178 family protein [Rhodoferax sp.]|jgi:hypothetical protein|nr:DUF1178 family protein [Rhodoferax sp.]